MRTTDYRYQAILAIALGVGMSVIDGTIANVALPTIARDQGTGFAVVAAIVSSLRVSQPRPLKEF